MITGKAVAHCPILSDGAGRTPYCIGLPGAPTELPSGVSSAGHRGISAREMSTPEDIGGGPLEVRAFVDEDAES